MPEMTVAKDLFSLTEAAFAVGKSYWATLRLVHVGDLPATRVSGRWFVSRSSLDAYNSTHAQGQKRAA